MLRIKDLDVQRYEPPLQTMIRHETEEHGGHGRVQLAERQ
jgi:hypothetical protein